MSYQLDIILVPDETEEEEIKNCKSIFGYASCNPITQITLHNVTCSQKYTKIDKVEIMCGLLDIRKHILSRTLYKDFIRDSFYAGYTLEELTTAEKFFEFLFDIIEIGGLQKYSLYSVYA